jgi:hypothetical protein
MIQIKIKWRRFKIPNIILKLIMISKVEKCFRQYLSSFDTYYVLFKKYYNIMEILDKVKNNAINNGISLDNAHISIKRNIQELSTENHNSNSIDDMIKYVYGVLNIINHRNVINSINSEEKQISVLY